MGVGEPRQGGGRDERDVAVEDEHVAVEVAERRHRALDGVTGAVLLGLNGRHDGQPGGERRRPHLVGLMTDDDHDAVGSERSNRSERMADERNAPELVEDLRPRRPHASAETRGQDDHRQRTHGRGLSHDRGLFTDCAPPRFPEEGFEESRSTT